jgi:hypothetical protein
VEIGAGHPLCLSQWVVQSSAGGEIMEDQS